MGSAAADLPRAQPHDGLLGRDDDVESVSRALEDSRLVTLTGAPGIGKTRLALAVADEQTNPAVVIELASIADPALIPSALATALAVQEAPGHSLIEAIIASLRRRPLLLLLDNCEHLRDPCALTAAQLLAECPDVSVLATSREPLGAPGELVWSVPPLAVPDTQDDVSAEALMTYPSIALFAERAAAVRPGFVMNAFAAQDVAHICRRLDGIPLAIELAAARAGTMTPPEIARRLDAHLGLLSERRLVAPSRHRTLAAALAWSYELLDAREQAILRRLAVFVGTFDLGAAQAICPRERGGSKEISGLLDRLVSKSLLAVVAPGRYRLLETVRAHAADRLEQARLVADVRSAHASYYTALAERAKVEFTGPRQLDWFDRIASERGNLRAAIEWTVARGHSENALRLAGALVLFWRVRGPYSEGCDLLHAALSAGERQEPALRAKALWGCGFLTLMTGDMTSAICLVEESMELFRELGDAQGCARAQLIRADAKIGVRVIQSKAIIRESIDLARQAGDHWCLAHALGVAGRIAHYWDEDYDDARARFTECLSVARAAGDLQGLRFGLIGLAQCDADQGVYPEAATLLSEAVEVTGALGEDYDRTVALLSLGQIALARGDLVHAREFAQRTLDLTPSIAPTEILLLALLLLAEVAHAEGNLEQARALLHEVATQCRPTVVILALGRLAVTEGDLTAARQLFDEALAVTWRASRRLTMAAALHELGLLARRETDAFDAMSLHGRALALQREIGALPAIADSLEAVAGLMACTDHAEHGARLMGVARSLRNAGGYARPPWERARYDADFASLRQSLPADAFARALAEGEASDLDDALADAFDAHPQAGSRSSWNGLTEREIELAELVAEGMSNPEIAERLVLSYETVRTHLSRIYSKLGIRGRRALALAFRARPNELPSGPPIDPSSSLRTEADAYRLLEQLRWPKGEPACPHCGSTRKHYFLTPKNGSARKTRTGAMSERRVWKCAACRQPFSVLTGTIMHGSKVPVRTWVLVVGRMARSPNGISTREIEHDYCLTAKTAALLVRRIGEAMTRDPMPGLLSSKSVAMGMSRPELLAKPGDGASLEARLRSAAP